MIIYCIINNENNKCYIGQTVDFKRRKITHKRELTQNNHYNSYLQRSWNKYGEDVFEWIVLEDEFETIDELNEAEQFWISSLSTVCPNGYNMNYGGNSSLLLEKTKKRISESLYKFYENNEGPNKGKMWSEESNDKRRQTVLKGYEEERIVPHWKGITGENHPNYGKSRPDISGENNINYWKGKFGKDHNSSIPIFQYDLDGNFIKEWDCAATAEKELGIIQRKIRSVCNKKRETAGEFQWSEIKKDKIKPITNTGQKRRVVQLTKNGEFIKEWKSMTCAGNELNIHNSNISFVCRGKGKTSGGFKWKYREDYYGEKDS